MMEMETERLSDVMPERYAWTSEDAEEALSVGPPEPRSPCSSRHILRSLRDLTGADGAFAFELVCDGGTLFLAEVEAIGPPAFVTGTLGLEGLSARAYFGAPTGDGWPSDVYRADSFTVISRNQGRQLGAWPMHWAPAGVTNTVGVSVTDGEVVVGGIVCVRLSPHRPFERHRLERLRAATARVGQVFTRTCKQRLAYCGPPGSENLLLFDMGGALVAADTAGPRWLDPPTCQKIGAMVRTRIDSRSTKGGFVRRAPVRFQRLDGRRPMVAAIVTEADRYRPGPLQKLTPVQRQVARIAAVGATIDEIARHLGRSPATVHHHLKGIYARLEIGCRVELARLVERVAP